MNNRIQELLNQSLDQAVPETWSTLSYEQMTKLSQVFAQLIVKECAGVADHSNVTGKSIIGERIKQHFGVEE